ncbi:unnamed protein product [Acanthosepion pharaonis]|uniref:Uncharacterized protein n=1 Tax=Acanthosepion pharaonis TaxID=158019 RepID=A0A812B6H6_ACAPH|nr:unnamed protein product [Sepia pharaonis]
MDIINPSCRSLDPRKSYPFQTRHIYPLPLSLLYIPSFFKDFFLFQYNLCFHHFQRFLFQSFSPFLSFNFSFYFILTPFLSSELFSLRLIFSLFFLFLFSNKTLRPHYPTISSTPTITTNATIIVSSPRRSQTFLLPPSSLHNAKAGHCYIFPS